ncbi:hypothetical protein SESBI_13000 [Sesbania bispinosa]|nr:hypothetical protein SESBI_13000 [Sesbania bispinosa]
MGGGEEGSETANFGRDDFGGVLGESWDNSGLGLGFQAQAQQLNKVTGLMGNKSDDPLMSLQASTNLPLNVNGGSIIQLATYAESTLSSPATPTTNIS